MSDKRDRPPTHHRERKSHRKGSSGAPQHEGVIPHFLHTVTRAVTRRPSAVLWVVGLLVLLSIGISVRFLTFKTNRSDLIDPGSEFHQRWLTYSEQFGEESDIVVVVEGDSRATIERALDDLGGQLQQEPELFQGVFYKFDPRPLRSKALQFLSPEELAASRSQLAQSAPILEGNWDAAGLEATTRNLQRQLSTENPPPQALAQAALLAESLQAFLTSQQFVSPWPVTRACR